MQANVPEEGVVSVAAVACLAEVGVPQGGFVSRIPTEPFTPQRRHGVQPVGDQGEAGHLAEGLQAGRQAAAIAPGRPGSATRPARWRVARFITAGRARAPTLWASQKRTSVNRRHERDPECSFNGSMFPSLKRAMHQSAASSTGSASRNHMRGQHHPLEEGHTCRALEEGNELRRRSDGALEPQPVL